MANALYTLHCTVRMHAERWQSSCCKMSTEKILLCTFREKKKAHLYND